MSKDELNLVELPAIQQLESLGWVYLEGEQFSPDISPERKSLKDIILKEQLTQSIKRINNWISDENLKKVVRELTQLQTSSLIEANQKVWETLVNYTSVEQDLGKGRKNQTVKIIDFDQPENNEFLCTNQFKVEGPKQNIIPDIILFVNGLPLGVIECKSPYITNPMESGIDQLLRYANRRHPEENEGCEKLFHYNQMMIATHRDRARVSTISAKVEHYLEWKDPYPLRTSDLGESPDSQEVLIQGMLNKKTFLDLIRNFIVFEPEDGRIIKKLTRYQQFRAVHKTMDRLKNMETPKERGGIVWHTQGSGKSLSMVFLAICMRNDLNLKDYKLVFLTDRTQLDNQLSATFSNTQGETIYRAKGVKDLISLLKKDSSDIVMGMMQKFQNRTSSDTIGELNHSDRILIICDEAHRTQYGTFASFMNEALPNAPKIAFTGTPLIASEKTENEFGPYIDTYTIEQSVEDGATVQIVYEGREAKTKVTGDSLDEIFEDYFSDKTEEEKVKIKQKYGTRDAILEAPNRIREVCKDIITHFESTVKPNGFKAMIVTNSRNAAVIYKEMIDELNGPKSTVVISGDHNDPERLRHYTDSSKQKIEIDEFKKSYDESDLSILIVKDMLLTGFDAPICQVMYLDRKLENHNLLQAIARVNRTKQGKFCGYIVDYFGLSDYLSEALEMFTQDDIKGALISIEDEIPKLKSFHTKCIQHFKGINLDNIDDCIATLREEVKRQHFEFDFRNFSKQMDIVMPNPAATPFINDLRLLGKICHGARNIYRDEQLNIAGAGEKVRQLIEEHIESTGVDPKIPPIDLLAKDFKEKVNEHKSERTRASEIEFAIKHHINVNIEQDPEFYRTLSEKLEEIIQENEGRWEQLVLLLMNFREGIEIQREAGAKEVGLSPVEFAFFNILIGQVKRVKGCDDLGDDIKKEIISIVKELVKKMEEATSIIEFFNKQDEINRIQLEIRRTIISSSFDSEELRKLVIEEFMDLAKVHFK